MQASNAFASAGAAAPDEFYDVYAMDLEAKGRGPGRAAGLCSTDWLAAITQSVHIGVVLDSALRRVWGGTVGGVDVAADRFWPTSALDATSGRLWVCFYDTSGDKSGKQAWFSCTSSRDGRFWTKPLRAASDSASPEVLWEDARVYAFGDVIGFGGYAAVAAAGGVAHPMWIDTRDVGGNKQEVFGARLSP